MKQVIQLVDRETNQLWEFNGRVSFVRGSGEDLVYKVDRDTLPPEIRKRIANSPIYPSLLYRVSLPRIPYSRCIL